MTRTSAITIAGGVVAALAASVAAVAVNVGILGAAEAPTGPGKLKAAKPIVRTVTQTRTVRRKARPEGPLASTVVQTVPGRAATDEGGSSESSFEDEYEDEDEDEDEYEDEYEVDREAIEDEHEYGEDDDD